MSFQIKYIFKTHSDKVLYAKINNLLILGPDYLIENNSLKITFKFFLYLFIIRKIDYPKILYSKKN